MAFEKWQFTRIVSTGEEPPAFPFLVDHLDGSPVYFVSEEMALYLWRKAAGKEREFMREYFDEMDENKAGIVGSVVNGVHYTEIVTHEDFVLARLKSIQIGLLAP